MAAVVGMGVPPWLELGGIPNPSQRSFAAAFLVLAAAAGVWAALRHRPLGARVTTFAYGTVTLGLGLFGTDRSLPYLLAYVVGLIGMNVLLHHDRTFGPVLAVVREDDPAAWRTRWVALRSLAVSAGALLLTYGLSLAVLPAFTIESGPTDPVVALALASGLIVILFLLALFPEGVIARARERMR